MKFQWLSCGPLTACFLPAHPAVSADDTLEEIVVTAGLRSTSVAELPQSVTVLDRDTLRRAGVQHFEDVLGLIPDLNWAAGTSRPRFFQLRGIGEVEQYQGAPNPSVGFLIDDIDFSGVGMPATLFDTQQIEVLRGPQGTAYGANALAGLISVRTADPGNDFELSSEVTGADYDTRAASLAIGDGFAGGSAGWRLVAQQYSSNGFRHNAYLNENSTNGFDEGTLRGKLRWQLTDSLRADLALMHVDINNGYDGWSIYNTYTTYSNQPGRDAQLSNGAALRLVDSINGVGELRSVTSAANSRITYSFDGDWGNDAYWAATTGFAPYDYFQGDNRNRRTLAQDLRLTGDPSRALFGRLRWLAGVYALRLTESDHQIFTWNAYDAGRGYKGGGFNIGSQILSEQRSFGPESLWSIETGFKYAEAGSPLQLQTDLFYMRRQSMQVYLSQQLQANNPLDYVFYTQNASNGENYGWEGEAAYRLNSRWQLSGSASLLHTRYVGVSGSFAGLGLDGRAQPFAPSYKLSAAAEYSHPAGWFARLDVSAIGSFYYYTSDAQASSAYQLENVRVGYKHGAWTTSLWVRNLFDARYAQQGFDFGLIPPNYPVQSFLQRGDPRQVGITVNYQLRQGAK